MPAAGETAEALFVQLSEDFYNLPLRARDVFDLDLSEIVHLFFHHLDGARRHVGEEALLQFFHRAFERERQRLLVHALKNLADAYIVNEQQVVERHHTIANLKRKLRVLTFDLFEHPARSLSVEAVANLCDGAHAAHRLPAEVADALEFLIQHDGDAADYILRDGLQVGHTQHDVGALRFGQMLKRRGGGRSVEVRKHDGDGLRMLVLKKFGELLRVNFLQRVEPGGRLQRVRDFIEQALGDFRPVCLDEQAPGIVNSARRHIGLRHQELIKLFQHVVSRVGRDALKRGQLS